MKDDYLLNSECLNSYLHRFDTMKEFPNGVLETCEICGMEVFFPVINGKLDNLNYMSYHARQALHPKHALFYHEYIYQPLNENIVSPYANQ